MLKKSLYLLPKKIYTTECIVEEKYLKSGYALFLFWKDDLKYDGWVQDKSNSNRWTRTVYEEVK